MEQNDSATASTTMRCRAQRAIDRPDRQLRRALHPLSRRRRAPGRGVRQISATPFETVLNHRWFYVVIPGYIRVDPRV